jgi:hypothetical protein
VAARGRTRPVATEGEKQDHHDQDQDDGDDHRQPHPPSSCAALRFGVTERVSHRSFLSRVVVGIHTVARAAVGDMRAARVAG